MPATITALLDQTLPMDVAVTQDGTIALFLDWNEDGTDGYTELARFDFAAN